MTRAAVPLIALLLAAGCGGSGGGGDTPEDQVRAAVRHLADSARSHQWGDFCAASTDPDACEASIANATALGVDAAQFIPSTDVLDKAHVTVNGDSATVDATAGEDARYVRTGDRWLWVWDGD